MLFIISSDGSCGYLDIHSNIVTVYEIEINQLKKKPSGVYLLNEFNKHLESNTIGRGTKR